LIAIKCSFWDFFNHYETISYRFSSTIEIIDFDALSNAILCRLRWFNFLMHANRDIFLSLETKTMKIVQKWRCKIIKIVNHVYQTIKNAKMQTFEEKSFYHVKTMIQENFTFFIFNDVDSKLEMQKNDLINYINAWSSNIFSFISFQNDNIYYHFFHHSFFSFFSFILFILFIIFI
jgi:hypothetical protein